MYDEILKELEVEFEQDCDTTHKDIDKISKVADLIIKIKTIQALDTSADLIRASRQVGRN